MTAKHEFWSRGLGSPTIMLVDVYTGLPAGSDRRIKIDALDNALRIVIKDGQNLPMLRRMAVAILNCDMVRTGQLFEIDADGLIIESTVVQDKLRELLAVFMCD